MNLEEAFAYNGPGASFVRLDGFLTDQRSNDLLGLAVESAKQRVASFDSTIPKDFLSTSIQAKTIIFGHVPTKAILDVLTQFLNLIPE